MNLHIQMKADEEILLLKQQLEVLRKVLFNREIMKSNKKELKFKAIDNIRLYYIFIIFIS